MDPARPRVAAIGVVDGRIVAVGSVSDVGAALPAGAPRVNVGSRMVLPGFTDAHIHYGYLVRKWNAVDLDDCPTLAEALRRVGEFARTHGPAAASWIDGHGWAAHHWEQRPTAAALDAVVSDRPVALTGKDGHSLWVNSPALAVAGIDRDTPNPPGGVIEKHPHTGEPTGVLYEEAMKLVQNALPPMDVDSLAEAMAAHLGRLHAQGITAVHCPELMVDFQAYQRLRDRGDLTVRVTYLPLATQLEHLIELGMETGFGDEWLRLGQLKIFSDGTLGSRTAAMLAPFEGEPGNVGVLVCGGEELKRLVGRAAQHRIAVAIHALGDRAVRETLDAIEHARAIEARLGILSLRHRVEHAQLVDPADMARFGRLGVVPSMQPAHCPADKANALRFWGPRVAYSSPFRSLADAGAILAFGSDAPFGLDLTDASFSVLAGMYAALTRRWVVPGVLHDGDVDANAGSYGAAVDGGNRDAGNAAADKNDADAYAPNEVLGLDEALAAYTTGAAYAGGEDGWRGALRVGHCADMVVLEENLYDVSVEDIPHVPVVATVVGGRPVFGDLFGYLRRV